MIFNSFFKLSKFSSLLSLPVPQEVEKILKNSQIQALMLKRKMMEKIEMSDLNNIHSEKLQSLFREARQFYSIIKTKQTINLLGNTCIDQFFLKPFAEEMELEFHDPQEDLSLIPRNVRDQLWNEYILNLTQSSCYMSGIVLRILQTSTYLVLIKIYKVGTTISKSSLFKQRQNSARDYSLGIFPYAAIGWFSAGQLFTRGSGLCYRTECMSFINHSLLPASVYRLPKPIQYKISGSKISLNK